MPVGTSLPPMPPRVALAVAGAVCVLVGAVLNLRGRTLGRVLLPLAAAAGGAAAAPWIAGRIPFKNVWVIGAVAALTLGVLAFVLSRMFWALLLGGILAAVAAVVLIRTGAPLPDAPSWPQEAPADFAAWCSAAAWHVAGWIKALFKDRPEVAALATGLPIVGCVVLELMFRGFVQMISTALAGAALVIGGALGLLWGVRAEWLDALVAWPVVPAIVVVGLAAAGAIVQIGGELRIRARAKKEQEEQEEQGDENETMWT